MIYPYKIMRAIIDYILIICRMRAKALSVLLDNTQRVLDQERQPDERRIDGRRKTVVESESLVGTSTRRSSSAFGRSERDQTFEEKIERQINELEAGVGKRLLGLDEAPGETEPSLTIRLVKPLKESAQDIDEDTPAPAQDIRDEELENVGALQQTRKG